jgi:4a-hydroxytetrahydrobiopterin dehydratase
MSDLAAKTCVPCRGGVPPLKGEELSLFQKQVDGWNIIEEHHITKTFKFPDFRGNLGFVSRVGELAEEQGHHPDISLAWGKVEITIWTHKINGLKSTNSPNPSFPYATPNHTLKGDAAGSFYPSECRTPRRRA